MAIEGLEICIFNREYAYDDILNMMNRSESIEIGATVSETGNGFFAQTLEANDFTNYVESSRLLRLFPLELEVAIGVIVIGNSELPSLISIKFKEASGVYRILKVTILLLFIDRLNQNTIITVHS